ncbi:hypothetical protein ABW20_dc0108768 [Dactylellina cionopaga]|nr:hypothetical protein ABW20_dc0108768 [Dactylellina cionopaga]
MVSPLAGVSTQQGLILNANPAIVSVLLFAVGFSGIRSITLPRTCRLLRRIHLTQPICNYILEVLNIVFEFVWRSGATILFYRHKCILSI